MDQVPEWGGRTVVVGGAGVGASVVVPAHQEEQALPRFLASLLAQDLEDLHLHVVIAVNGSTDRTAALATAAIPYFAGHGHRLDVLDLPVASKAAALNAADRATEVFPRIYSDADILLSANAIRRVVEELDATSEPRLAAPTVRVATCDGLAARHYGEVWGRLPNVCEQVAGVGFYAVNEAGRARWWRFSTRLGADDKFVRLHFRRHESVVVPDAWFEVYLPERPIELARVRGRWHEFNREISRICPGLQRHDKGRWKTSLRYAATTPSSWRHLPLFAAIWIAGWVVAARSGGGSREWSRATSSAIRTPPTRGTSNNAAAVSDPTERWQNGVDAPVLAPPSGPAVVEGRRSEARPSRGRHVHAVVVIHNSGQETVRCVDALLASTGVDSIQVTVVDNASTDGGAGLLESRFPRIELIANETNVGFGAAVNQALESSQVDWFTVVNPDAQVRPETIAESIAYLELNPAGGICGVPAVDAHGTVNDRSFFAFPTLWSEVTLALGLHRLAPDSRLANPEHHLAHRPLTEPIEVEAVAGCFTVVDRTLWKHLDGYDQSYFLCGEDLDLCLRAIETGASPVVIPAQPIQHLSGHSFSGAVDARAAYLRGRTEFQQRWWTSGRAAAARTVRRTAILARLVLARVAAPGRAAELTSLWQRRAEWSEPGRRPVSSTPSGSERAEPSGVRGTRAGGDESLARADCTADDRQRLPDGRG